jgi:epoxyqueuosine reductase
MAVIDWEPKLQELCEKIGASHAGLSTLSEPITWKHYETWLKKGYAGEMEYLKTHAPFKKNPESWKPTFTSAIVVAFPYVDHPEPMAVLSSARIALYAKGYDYHYWIKSRLQSFITELEVLYPIEKFETHTDSSPLLERDLAQRAGLGWFGKNTCLIHPKKGSLFLIGEILTTLKFDIQVEAVPDFCGKCQKCMEVCPTQALTSLLNAFHI